MKISHRGLKLIAGYEGFRSKPYLCPAGKLTIGFGHVILPGEKFTEISIQEAEQLLKKDCEIAERAVFQLVKVSINQDIFDALVSFVFNIGVENFKQSSVLRYLNQRDYYQAAMSFSMWVNVNGQPLKGLIKRRAEEQLLFTIGCVKSRFIT